DTVWVPVTGDSVESHISLTANESYLITASGFFSIDDNPDAAYRKMGDAEYGRYVPTPDAYSQLPFEIKYGVGINNAGLGMNMFPYWGAPSSTTDHSYTISYTPDASVASGQPQASGILSFNYHDSYYGDNQAGYLIQIQIYRAVTTAPIGLTSVADQTAGTIH